MPFWLWSSREGAITRNLTVFRCIPWAPHIQQQEKACVKCMLHKSVAPLHLILVGRRRNLRQNIGQQWQVGGNLTGGRNAKTILLQQRSTLTLHVLDCRSGAKLVGYRFCPRKEWSDQIVPYHS